MAKFDKKLAQIVVKANLVSQEQVDTLLAEVEKKGDKSLTQLLLDNSLVDEGTIIGTLSEEMNIPPIDLAKVDVSEDALEVMTEDLANYYQVLPVSKIGNVLTIAVANPFDIFTIDDVKIVTGHELLPVVSTDVSIKKAISKVYNRAQGQLEDLMEGLENTDFELTEETEEEAVDMGAVTGDDADNPVVQMVNLIILQAIKQRASDIHLEVYEKRTRVRYRIDGSLQEVMAPPKKMYANLTSRVKVMCPEIDIAERRRPQDGKFQMKVDRRNVDFRVSVLPIVYGEKVVIRILDSSNLTLTLDELGFEEKALKDFRSAVNSPYGMMLVTGPTGSGKSTTLYSAVREVLNDEDNISTVEEPVEYQLDGVNQVPINEKRGLTFDAALRSLLRQDPDTIMIGEIRDKITAEIAVKAALTGHLVFSTLHTNDAPSTVTRLVDMGVDSFLVSSSVVLVSAQRLVKRLCPECKEKWEPPKEHLLEWEFSEEEAEQGVTVYKAAGCGRCSKGYKGRMALLETMPMTDAIRRIIVTGGSALDLKAQALKEGMITLRRVGLNNALRGKTSMEEVLSITMADN
ncbi:MAG: Flp pilus assembly complex ATPase component TadA [Planctomycetes bacterium]|nr:Flp pilus assembly complex ATPase component TadA [Planctomycetota bacterium]